MSKVVPQTLASEVGERYVEIRKRRKLLAYEKCPENYNGDTLFFYHGAGGTYHHFHHQLHHAVSLGYRVVTCDMFGHGGSKAGRGTTRHDFAFEQYCYDALALFDKFSVSDRNVLVGHSYGTSLCTLVCSERRSKVYKMILLSGGGPYALAPQKLSVFSLPVNVLNFFKPLIMRIYRKACFHVQCAMSDDHLLSTDFRTLRHVMRGQIWESGDEEYHAQITCPVLLALGKHDKFIARSDEIHMLKILPQAVLHILKGGHMLPVECGAQVNALITSFLQNEIAVHSKCHSDTLYNDHTKKNAT